MSTERFSMPQSAATDSVAHVESASQTELASNGGKETQPSKSLAAQFESQSLLCKPSTAAAEAAAFGLGDIVSVAPRSSGVGCGLEGGLARIVVVHDPSTSSSSGTSSDTSGRGSSRYMYEVKYVLGGKEKNVSAERLAPQSAENSKGDESSSHPTEGSNSGTSNSRRSRATDIAQVPIEEDATESDDDDDDDMVMPPQKAQVKGMTGATSETGSLNLVDDSSAIKKRRGRPPKSPIDAMESGTSESSSSALGDDLTPVKKRRGRPPKDAANATTVTANVEKGATSEASNSAPDYTNPGKKRRGRPPKSPIDAMGGETSESSSSALGDDVTPVKKRRGRPPKDAANATTVTANVEKDTTSETSSSTLGDSNGIVKRRGRPPKDAANTVIKTLARRSDASESGNSTLDNDVKPVKKRGRPPKGPQNGDQGIGGGRGRGGKGMHGGRGRGAGSRSIPTKTNGAARNRSGDTTSSDEDSDATDDVESDSTPETERENGDTDIEGTESINDDNKNTRNEHEAIIICSSDNSSSDGRVAKKKLPKGASSKENGKMRGSSSNSACSGRSKASKKSTSDKASDQFLANFVAKKATNGVRREWCDMCRGKSEGYGSMVSTKLIKPCFESNTHDLKVIFYVIFSFFCHIHVR